MTEKTDKEETDTREPDPRTVSAPSPMLHDFMNLGPVLTDTKLLLLSPCLHSFLSVVKLSPFFLHLSSLSVTLGRNTSDLKQADVTVNFTPSFYTLS